MVPSSQRRLEQSPVRKLPQGEEPMQQEKANEILTELQESGVMNMFGAPRWLEERYGLPRQEAKELFIAWTETFDE